MQCVITKLTESFRARIVHSIEVRGHVTAFVCADLAIELLVLQIAPILSGYGLSRRFGAGVFQCD